MDPEVIKKMVEATTKEIGKIWGPHTPEFMDFLNKQELIDHRSLMAPGSHLVQHYKVDGKFTLTQMLARGYYEGKKLNLTKDDVVLASFPKTGTTWIQQIIYLISTDCDIEAARLTNIDERVPAIDWPECTFKVLQERPPPRLIKTHIPYSMLPGGEKKDYKIVYGTRNPKDTAVSMFHFYKFMTPLQFVGDMNDMLNLFLSDAAIYCPFDEHALEYWSHVKDGNVLLVKYEDLHKDAEGEIRRIAKFLEKDLSDEQIRKIVHETSFQQMAATPTCNHSQWEGKNLSDKASGKFMRKGKVGDWKNHFDEEMNKRFDEYIRRALGNSDLTYDYE